MSADKPTKIETRLAHAGRSPHDHHGAVNPPVYHASTILQPSLDAWEALRKPGHDGYGYGRDGTPTTRAFETAMGRDLRRRRCGRGLVRPGRDHGRADGPYQGRRPYIGHRQRLLPQPQILRGVLEEIRRRHDLLRPDHRHRHIPTDPAGDQPDRHRIPRLGHVRDAGHPGHRGGGALRAASR